jgi:hypothetical protein
MKVHVLVDVRHEVLAYVPVPDSGPRPVLAPLDPTHTVYEHIEVPDTLAPLRGADAFLMVQEHLGRHLDNLRREG